MKKLIRVSALLIIVALSLVSCKQQELSIDFEEYTLENGLKVVLHQDNSDPVVAQAITFHVGSAREKEGKTGFAHFFEHMLFQRSENLPRNSFFTKIAEMGGNFNGGTSNDYTIYFESVPRNALEKILWMESDRMGYFINTVTQQGLEREIDVILNEKRETEVNNPYGMMEDIMCKNLFPKGHPYSWTVIGEYADISSATIEDVKEFYSTYYVPSNATLCIAGDIDIEETKALIEKYFAEIPNKPVERQKVWNVPVEQSKKLYYEDLFANMPAVSLGFTAVEQSHSDAFALDALTSMLAEGKNSPLYRTIVEKNLAPEVSMYYYGREVTGNIFFDVTSYPDVDLDQILAAFDEAMKLFESEGVNLNELDTYKAKNAANSYKRLGSVLGKAMMLSESKEFYGKPDKFIDDIEALQAVTAEDIMRVYNKYLKGQNFVAVSAVPKGEVEMAIEGSDKANVIIEDATQQRSRSQAGAIMDENDYERTPSKIDRSIEPAYMANTPSTNLPQIWRCESANGIKVSGITRTEVPLVEFTINIKGGMLLNPADKPQVASINADMMNEGTAKHTASEIEQMLGKLGASVNVSSNTEYTTIRVSSLAKNLPAVISIISEMLTEPRFDQEAFNRAIMASKSNIEQSLSSCNIVGQIAAMQLYFGESIYARKAYENLKSLEITTLEDIKDYFKNIVPGNATISVAGDVTMEQFSKALANLDSWTGAIVDVPEAKFGKAAKAGTYFVEFPGAQQSMIIINGKAKSYADADYHILNILNEKLGSGSNGKLFEVLRLQHGYTYGAYSEFSHYKNGGLFTAYSSVQSTVTKESVDLFKNTFDTFGPNYTAEQLESVKDAMIRANAGRFENLNSLVYMLNNIEQNNLPDDYILREEAIVKNTTLEQIKAAAEEYLNSDKMIVVVTGDKAQLKNLKGAKIYKIQ